MNCAVLSHSVMADSATPWTAVHQAVCPWNSPDKNTIVGCHFLLQGIFLTQGSNPCLLCLLHWQADSLPQSHLGSPIQMNYRNSNDKPCVHKRQTAYSAWGDQANVY